MTSSACVPTEPVDPSTTTPRVMPSGYGSEWLGQASARKSEDLELEGEVVGDRKAEQQRVEAVEHAAVAREQGPEVLDAEIALEHRFAEIADERTDRDQHAEQRTSAHRPRIDVAHDE